MSEVEASTPEAPEKSLSLLAKESFGGNYYGEVSEPETPKEPEEPEAQEQSDEVEEKPEEGQPGPEEGQEQESDEGPEGEVTISSFDELVENQGWDPEWANSLEIPVKVDGETSKAKLSDLVKSYQMTEAAEKRLEEAKEKAKSQHQALATKQQELDATMQVAASVLQSQLDQIEKQESEVDWKALREQDPGEAALKRQEFAERKNGFRNEIGKLVKAYQQNQQKTLQEQEQERQKKFQAEEQALLEKLPEWKDEETASVEQKKLGEYLMSQELSEDSMQQATFDHKLLIMARKAMLYDQIKDKSEPAKKKLVKVPKTLKPGGTKPEVNTNQSKINELQKKISANPNSMDALDAAREIYKLRRGN